MKEQRPFVLLINPWVRDFKCYDEWMEPLGLLWISAFLKAENMQVNLVDCLDRYPSKDTLKPGKQKKFGTGDFSAIEIEKPELYSQVPRKVKQYGISEESFISQLGESQAPDLILISSGMTYWCDGVKRSIELIRRVFPSAPLALGGVLASLCPEFSKKIPGVDEVIAGSFCTDHMQKIFKLLGKNQALAIPSPDQWPDPDYALLNRKLKHRALITAFGCPFKCTYCASRRLAPKYYRRPAEVIIEEILKARRDEGIHDFAFYDDALLFHYESNLQCILEALREKDIKVRFHTPNGMHAKWISPQVAQMLHDSGFQTLRIGFETDVEEVQESTGGKVSNAQMDESLANLREAGFKKSQIGVYLMVGMNGEPWQETVRRAKWIQARGARALPNFLSPVPFTEDFEKLSTQYPILMEDPRSHNDIFFAFHTQTVDHESFNLMKRTIREGNA